MSQTTLITGSSRGIGRLSVQFFQKKGWQVIAAMRSPEKETELNKLDNVLVTRLDVTDKASIQSAVDAGIKKFGSIDVLVNNAGDGFLGPIEALPEAKIREQFEVNVFGLINVTRAVLPHMRASQSGMIINISSISGLLGGPYTSMYCGSKFAVEGISEALQYELIPFGIQVKLVEPGVFKTDAINRWRDFFWNSDNIPDYQAGMQKYFKAVESMVDNAGDPQIVAETIYEAATDSKEQLRYLIGDDAVQIMEARKPMDDVTWKHTLAKKLAL